MELVSVVVGGDDVEQQDVLGLGVQPRQPELHLREHLPETRGGYSLQGGRAWVHRGSGGTSKHKNIFRDCTSIRLSILKTF